MAAVRRSQGRNVRVNPSGLQLALIRLHQTPHPRVRPTYVRMDGLAVAESDSRCGWSSSGKSILRHQLASCFLFQLYVDLRDLRSFPARRSSDLEHVDKSSRALR